DAYAEELATVCLENTWISEAQHEPPWSYFSGKALHDPWKHTVGQDAPQWSPSGATEPSSGTTHVSAADADGWVVGITHTAANHFGSGVMCPRTGLLFDSSMAWFNALPGSANSIRSAARPVANMAPILVKHQDGSIVQSIGASGGRRIISAVIQLAISLTEGGLNAAE